LLYLTKPNKNRSAARIEKGKKEIDLRKLGISEEVEKISYKTLTDGIMKPRLNEIFSLVGEELTKIRIRRGYSGRNSFKRRRCADIRNY